MKRLVACLVILSVGLFALGCTKEPPKGGPKPGVKGQGTAAPPVIPAPPGSKDKEPAPPIAAPGPAAPAPSAGTEKPKEKEKEKIPAPVPPAK